MEWLTQIDWVASIVWSCIGTAVVNVIIWAFQKARAKDIYEAGFEDGFRSNLMKFAKLRYHKDLEICVCIVPETEWEKELDQRT